MPGSFEELMTLHDGERTSRDEHEANGPLGEDPEARELLEKLAEADRAFKDAADDLLGLPVPPELVDAIRKPATGVQPSTARVIPFPRRRGLIGLAIAAGLAAVVATNIVLFESTSESSGNADALVSLLQETLESVPSGDITDSGDGSIRVTPILTFRTESDRFCREFMALRNDTEISGVACRDEGGRWNLSRQQQLAVGSGSNDYRAAEGEDGDTGPPADIVIAEELSYAAEQEAIRSGWSSSGRR